MNSETVIECKDLVRIYRSSDRFLKKKKETLAVNNISFEVRRGELFGMLGPNGAGKTTTIKMMTTLLLPTSGSVKGPGHDVAKDPSRSASASGWCWEGRGGFTTRVTARQNLRYFADLYGGADEHQGEADRGPVGKGRPQGQGGHPGGGLLPRDEAAASLAKGLINDPEVIFMDEPTIGLDPEAARDAAEMIKELVAEGKTILLTTHYMYEADELCDRIAVINKGKIVALDTPKGLKSLVKDTVHHRGGRVRHHGQGHWRCFGLYLA